MAGCSLDGVGMKFNPLLRRFLSASERLKLLRFVMAVFLLLKPIKFTAEYSTQEVPFLDTLVYKLNDRLATKVYHKKTDDEMYLHYSSAHPRSQKDAISYSLFIKCKRICTENRYFNMEVQEITNKLAHRGYPKDLIVKSYLKAKNQDRDNLLKMDEKPNNQENKIRLITTYNKHNPPMKEILQRYKDYFLQNRKGIDFQNIQTVYRRASNLRDKLVRGQAKKELKLGITSPCNKPCITCPKMDARCYCLQFGGVAFCVFYYFFCNCARGFYYSGYAVMSCNFWGML